MIEEILRVKGNDDDRDFHLLVTKEETATTGLEEVTVSFMMDQEQRLALVEHLARIADKEGVVGFTITFGVRSTLDPYDGVKIFSDRIKNL